MITSPQNEAVKTIVKLHVKKGRKEQGLFLVEGVRACTTFADNDWKPTQIYTTPQHAANAKDLFDQEPTLVSDIVMKKMSASVTPSGFVCTFKLPTHEIPAQPNGIVLVDIADPGNMGTLIRSAVSFGKSDIICVDGCDPFSPKVVQSTAGTLAMARVFSWTWEQLLERKNAPLCALVVDSDEHTISADSLLVVGNEAHGLLPTHIRDCEQSATLKMPGQTESLNASVAGSIALYLQNCQ